MKTKIYAWHSTKDEYHLEVSNLDGRTVKGFPKKVKTWKKWGMGMRNNRPMLIFKREFETREQFEQWCASAQLDVHIIKRRRICSNCGGYGHISKTCKLAK